MKDLTLKENVVKLMKNSKNQQEWRDNCDIVKEANDGYPGFWFKEVISSGLCDETLGQGSSKFKIDIFK